MNKANKFVMDFGWDKATKLLETLRTHAVPNDMKINIINGMWHRSSVGFTYPELKRLVESNKLVERFGGLENAKKYIDNFILPELSRAIADVEACQ